MDVDVDLDADLDDDEQVILALSLVVGIGEVGALEEGDVRVGLEVLVSAADGEWMEFEMEVVMADV